MKKVVLILLLLLVLFLLGRYLVKRFLKSPEIHAQVFLNKILTEKKIYYTVDYSGVTFDGVYDLAGAKAQMKEKGEYKIGTVKDGSVFGIALFRKDKKLGDLLVDIVNLKLMLNAGDK